ncbi:MAG: hypothetical protein BM485_15400, partial [Desulfobulbaceae bacterium DB1]
SSSLYFEDDYNKYHAKIRKLKFYIVLGQKTPDVAYRFAKHGGALIVDRFPDREKKTEQAAPEKIKSGQRRPAVDEVKCAA